MPKDIKGIKFFTVQEIAKELDVTPQTIREYIKRDQLPAQRIGRPLLVKETDLNKFLGV